MTAATQDLASLLRSARLIPVLTIERVDRAVPLARALLDGGVSVLEVTLRTPAGADAAAAIQQEVSGVTVGLGTVTASRDLMLAKRLRLPFAFSPGATPELLDAAVALDVPLIPGIATASELLSALTRGFTTVKLFPAEPLGGVRMVKALSGPFPKVLFNPTGGIGAHNFADYLALPNVVAVGGSWLAPRADIEARRWSAITERTRQATQSIASHQAS